MQIAVFVSQAAGNQTDLAIQQIVTANQAKEQVSQPTRIINQSDRRVRNGKGKSSHVNFLDDLSRSFTKLINPKNLDETFLLRKQNYKTIVNIGPISFVVRKLPVILDTESELIFLRENQLMPFQDIQVVHLSE